MLGINDKFPKGVEVVGSAVIENEAGQILLVRSPKWNNKWTFPGGHIEPGETIVEAVRREAKEETGLELEAIDIITWGELLGSADFHRAAHFIYFDVYYKKVAGELKLDNRELTDYKWLAPDEALRLDLAESFPETIQKFIEYKNG